MKAVRKAERYLDKLIERGARRRACRRAAIRLAKRQAVSNKRRVQKQYRQWQEENAALREAGVL